MFFNMYLAMNRYIKIVFHDKQGSIVWGILIPGEEEVEDNVAMGMLR